MIYITINFIDKEVINDYDILLKTGDFYMEDSQKVNLGSLTYISKLIGYVDKTIEKCINYYKIKSIFLLVN